MQDMQVPIPRLTVVKLYSKYDIDGVSSEQLITLEEFNAWGPLRGSDQQSEMRAPKLAFRSILDRRSWCS